MKTPLIALAAFLVFGQRYSGPQSQFGGLQLLEGYTAKRQSAVDATAWIIEGKTGVRVTFEAGPSEGSWADPEERGKYAWYREQTMHGYLVRFALVKAGLKTQWEPESGRGLTPGNILLVTYLLGGPKSNHTANFAAKIADSAELGDCLLMVATFDPSKGSF